MPNNSEKTPNEFMQMPDPYLWLEEIESEKSLRQVEAWNRQTLNHLQAQPHFPVLKREIEEVLLHEDRIAPATLRDGWIYQFWQDRQVERGVWRRCPLLEFEKALPPWEVLLDLDEKARHENENWVWTGVSFLPPPSSRCLITLSRGGTDASVVREFDLITQDFVPGGFYIPEAKSNVSWVDPNRLFVGTDWGPGTKTQSGYPREVRVLNRGQALHEARTCLQVETDDMSAFAFSIFDPHLTTHFLVRQKNFYATEIFRVLDLDRLSLQKLPVPEDFQIHTIFQNWILGSTLTDWIQSGRRFASGSLLRLNLRDLDAGPECLFTPSATQSLQEVTRSKSMIWVLLQDQVQSRLLIIDPLTPNWELTPAQVPVDGTLQIHSASPYDDQILFDDQSFLRPVSLSVLSDQNRIPQILKRSPSQFRSDDLMTEQKFSISPDGTRIPYFVIRKKDLVLDGRNPTVLYGYGGFLISLGPSYLGATGKAWLERGGVYVIANIRGGGEFGPDWHRAVLQENRQKAYDDFFSVAEALIDLKVTSPKHLGIMGGSNGGLLVGVAFTQRPELFRAVVCLVPLLDMFRYHELLAGASWMAEYGDPRDPPMASVLRSYSPYQNLNPAKKYPKVFFMTSTKDDRVHPGHARKMAARMQEQAHDFYYYENIEGGHGAAANLQQRIQMAALCWTYFGEQLIS